MKIVLHNELINELISYSIVTSITIYEITLAFRNVEYYLYQFFWPKVLLIYTPIFITIFLAICHLYKNNVVKLFLTALFPVLILLGLALIVLNELTDQFSPDVFFKSYIEVIIISSCVWLFVAFIDKKFKKMLYE